MSYDDNSECLKQMKGKVISKITGLTKNSEEVRIFTECGKEYIFEHYQNCCEYVRLVDFEEDDDLIGAVIVSAEEVINEIATNESGTWTFYKIETNQGGLWMRWLGESNGYYSERVDIRLVNEENK